MSGIPLHKRYAKVALTKSALAQLLYSLDDVTVAEMLSAVALLQQELATMVLRVERHGPRSKKKADEA